MFTEVGVPLVAVLFLDVNAGIILLMIGSFLVHEATALWDMSYATTARSVTPIEQHVHSFLEMIPLMPIVAIVGMHWGQFLALFGLGDGPARFALVRKAEPLPMLYVAAVFAAVVLVRVPALSRGACARPRRKSRRSRAAEGTPSAALSVLRSCAFRADPGRRPSRRCCR
jgi:hypothetical protein